MYTEARSSLDKSYYCSCFILVNDCCTTLVQRCFLSLQGIENYFLLIFHWYILSMYRSYRILCSTFIVNKLLTANMTSFSSYEEAVHKLNLLQSNKSTLEQIRREVKSGKEKCTNLQDMENYLSRIGISLEKLDTLSVIHVAGTKGKGSTSAMCESILRHRGFKTGFYSSPHLVAVRERIRLNGLVISEEKFAKHFHDIYNKLNGSKADERDMPKYFAFLTVLAYSMFLKEKVDVAIIEVGIGGVVDYTNILRRVPVVGITALGLDHTSILGNTIEQIAAAKAGIMKPGCDAYTVMQPPEALSVLMKVAADKKCTLKVVPDYDSYEFPQNHKSCLSVDLAAYRMNASLAIQLAHAWIRIFERNVSKSDSLRKNMKGRNEQNGYKKIDNLGCNAKIHLNGNMYEMSEVLPVETVMGLRECRWPGRYHKIESDYATFYLDGAHTKESMEICVEWFDNSNRNDDKTLIFSATGDRDAEVLLQPLKQINFTTAYFVIPSAYKELNKKNDNYSAIMEQNELLSQCHKHAYIWKNLCSNTNNSTIVVQECVSDALINVKNRRSITYKSSVLITGSLHLVGAALSILDPNLSKC